MGERFAEELLQRGRLEEAQRLFERARGRPTTTDRVTAAALAAGAAAARLVGDEAMRLLEETADGSRWPLVDEEAAAEALRLVGDLRRTGSRDHGEPSSRRTTTEAQLAEARRRAPAGSAAEATVLVAAAAWLPGGDPEAERTRLLAAERAAAAGLPVAASAALDSVCASHLLRWEYAEALATVAARGRLMDPLAGGRDDGVRVQRLPAHGLRGVARRRRPARALRRTPTA